VTNPHITYSTVYCTGPPVSSSRPCVLLSQCILYWLLAFIIDIYELVHLAIKFKNANNLLKTIIANNVWLRLLYLCI